jgi:hypothetical protein
MCMGINKRKDSVVVERRERNLEGKVEKRRV